MTEVETGPWAKSGLPYGGLVDNGDTWELSYRQHSVSIPATNAEWTEAAASEPGGETPRLELSTAGATAEAGIFQLRPPGGASLLWILTEGGDWDEIATGLSRIALADVHGHYVAWVQGAGDDGVKRDGTSVRVYDTQRGAIVGDLPATELPGDRIEVRVVSGTQIVIRVADIASPTESSNARNFVWSPLGGQRDVAEVSLPDRVRGSSVTAYHSGSGAMALMGNYWPAKVMAGGESAVRDLPEDGFVRFNREGTQLTLIGNGPPMLLDAETLKPIPLEIPMSSLEEFVLGAVAWTANDDLAVIGSMADQKQEAFICDPVTGRCENLGLDYLWPASLENSSRGQVAYRAEPEGD